MSKKDIQRVLNLKAGTFKQFFKEVTDAEILIEKDDKFYLSKMHFYRGEIDSKRDEIACGYTRMFVNTVRQIYNSMKTSKHNLLSYVFQLIPCVHYSTNFICKNVASSYTSIEYMNIEDICNFLRLSTDKKNMRKLKKELMSIHVECDGRMTHLINESDFLKVQQVASNVLYLILMWLQVFHRKRKSIRLCNHYLLSKGCGTSRAHTLHSYCT